MSHPATISRKGLRYQPNLEGLAELVEHMTRIRATAERLPLAKVWSQDHVERLMAFDNFLRKILKDRADASVDRTIRYGAKLLRELEDALENLFEGAVKTFESSVDYARKNAPETFLAYANEIASKSAAYQAALDDENAELHEVADRYIAVHELLAGVQITIRRERRKAQEAQEASKRRERDDKALERIRSLVMR
jgi:hypothetical protein